MKLLQSGNVQACKMRVYVGSCKPRWFAGTLFQPCELYLLDIACSVIGKTGTRGEGSDTQCPKSIQNTTEILSE